MKQYLKPKNIWGEGGLNFKFYPTQVSNFYFNNSIKHKFKSVKCKMCFDIVYWDCEIYLIIYLIIYCLCDIC